MNKFISECVRLYKRLVNITSWVNWLHHAMKRVL